MQPQAPRHGKATAKRIATRKSPLALWQARQTEEHLRQLGFSASLVTTVTTGDRLQQTRLSNEVLGHPSETLGSHLTTGKGLFIKEVQDLLLHGDDDERCHVAVHSMKDLPVTQTPGLVLAGFLQAASPQDVLVLHPEMARCPELARSIAGEQSDLWATLDEVWCSAAGAASWNGRPMGTTSLRRSSLLRHLGLQHLPIEILRGNVDTRLRRLRSGDFSTLILAEAGLRRLELFDDTMMIPLPIHTFVPACTQGVVALEAHGADTELTRALYLASEPHTIVRVAMERLVLHLLDGGCHSAIGIHVSLSNPEGLWIFTAEGDGTSGHTTCLGLDEPLGGTLDQGAHPQAQLTLRSLIQRTLQEWQSFAHFSDLQQSFASNNELCGALRRYLENQGHVRSSAGAATSGTAAP